MRYAKLPEQLSQTADVAVSATAEELGVLPEWNLDDLYSSPSSQELEADYAKAERDAENFAKEYQGKLAKLAKKDGAKLAKAIRRFEALQDLMGRIASYATLLYTGNTIDPERAKFYGDMQETITRISTHLLFFGLEINRIDDRLLDTALEVPELAHYRPWLMDLRKERPFQLDDKIEQLFHEKSVTGRGAFNRLFDETMAGLRFDVDGKELTIEPTLNLLVSPDAAKREKGAKAISQTLNENIRTFTLITNTLAKDKEISDRWRGFDDIAASRHLANRVERDVVDALVSSVEEAYPRLSHRYYAMKAKWLGMDKLKYWDRNAPLPETDTNLIGWNDAREIVLDAYGGFAPQMANIAQNFFDKNWIDAPVREGKSTGAFAHRPCPLPTLMCF